MGLNSLYAGVLKNPKAAVAVVKFLAALGMTGHCGHTHATAARRVVHPNCGTSEPLPTRALNVMALAYRPPAEPVIRVLFMVLLWWNLGSILSWFLVSHAERQHGRRVH